MIDQLLSDLINDCRRGKEVAMRLFYERYYGYALSVCLAYANDRSDADELVNDGFLKVFRSLDKVVDEAALLPWLRRIMVNTAIDHYRKNRKRVAHVSTEAVEHTLAEPYLNDDAMFARFSAEDILALLHQLPASHRLVFSLYVLEGYAHREIAGQLGLAESTSRAYLTEANHLLRRALTSQTNHADERTPR